MHLGINKVIVSKNKNPLKLLVVDIDHVNNMIAVTDLLTKPFKRPKTIPYSTIEKKCAANEWEISEHSFEKVLYAPDEDIPPKWIEIRDKNYGLIKELVEDKRRLYHYLFGDSTGILKSLVKASGKTKKVVQSALNNYFANGQFENSLLPLYYECGQHYKGPEAPVVLENGDVCLKSKPGIVTTHGEPYRHRTRQDNTQIEEFAKTIARNQTYILEKLYRQYVKNYCMFKLKPKCIPDKDIAADFYAVLPRRHRISPRSFKSYLQRVVGPLKWIKMRKGSINFERDNAGKPGMALEGLRGPGSRYEIDSTVADCYIRYEYSEELLSIGRPIIYLVIDVMSTMITGVHVCFHGPDWHGESQALFNAFSDKKEFCERFGVKYKEGDWPCNIVSLEITFDRGTENTHKHLAGMLKGEIGVTGVNYNPYHRGDAKGTVEKKFDILQSKTIPEGNGKVQKVPRKEDQHPSRKPVYTYKQFMKRLITHIIHVNNKSTRIDSHNFEMEKAGVACRPRDVWNWGIENAVIPPNKCTKDQLRFALLPEEKAVVRDKGIYFRGLYYCSKEVVAKEWLTKAKNTGRYPIDVRYSDIDTTYIWCKDPDEKNGPVIQLETTRRSKKYAHMQWFQVSERLALLKDQLAREEEDAFVSEVLMELELDVMDEAVNKEIKSQIASEAKGIQPDVKDYKDQQASLQKLEEYKTLMEDLTSQKPNDTPVKSANEGSSLAKAATKVF